jgi:hypothetical protein
MLFVRSNIPRDHPQKFAIEATLVQLLTGLRTTWTCEVSAPLDDEPWSLRLSSAHGDRLVLEVPARDQTPEGIRRAVAAALKGHL